MQLDVVQSLDFPRPSRAPSSPREGKPRGAASRLRAMVAVTVVSAASGEEILTMELGALGRGGLEIGILMNGWFPRVLLCIPKEVPKCSLRSSQL